MAITGLQTCAAFLPLFSELFPHTSVKAPGEGLSDKAYQKDKATQSALGRR